MRRIQRSGMAGMFLVLFLFFALRSFADTIVPFHDISFHSDFEKEVLTDFLETGRIDASMLFLATDPSVHVADFEMANIALLILTEKYNAKKYRRFGGTRLVSKIVNDVNRKLEAYEQSAGFSSVIEIGKYQPVTSVMLFSLIFSRLQIPFTIKQTGYYAYLVAYPEDEGIVVETDELADESLFIDDRLKSGYVRLLYDQELISEEEYQDDPVDLLFDRYYRNTKSIDQTKLAALQYHRLALVAMAKNEFSKGCQLMEKAYLLHPHQHTAIMLSLFLNRVLAHLDISTPEYATYLAKLMRLQNIAVNGVQLLNLFSDLTSRQLLIERNPQLYDESFHKIISQVNDPELFSEISFLYHFERGRVLFINSEYTEAEPFIVEAFKLEPKNADVKSMFFGIMLAKMEELKTGEDAYTLSKFADYFETITDYKNRFEQLNAMPGFRKAWLFFCMNLMDQYYQFEDAENGEKYRMIFETEYPAAAAGYEGINKSVSDAYFSAATYYRNKGNLTKSLEMNNKGLEYVPGSPKLLKFKNALKK